jgi:hypothetical protein
LFLFSGRSCFPVVPAFRLFLLSGRSLFPVILAFRSSLLSGHFCFPVVLPFRLFPAFWSFLISGPSIKHIAVFRKERLPDCQSLAHKSYVSMLTIHGI